MSEYICPHCNKPIYDDEALLCLYCGESLNRATGFMGKLKYSKPRLLIAAIIVVVILSFLVLMFR